MGPPSRYIRYAEAHAQALQAQNSVPLDTGWDTSSLSNTELAKYQLRLLAAATSPEEFDVRANAVFSRNVNITLNGLHLSRELYAKQWGASFRAPGKLIFSGAMETPNVRIPMLQNAALVGIMYDSDFPIPADGLGAVRSRTAHRSTVSVSSTINLIIAEDKSLPVDSGDRRRIVSINQVIVDKDGLLTFPLRNL